MKVLHYFVLLVVCTLFLLPGCGSKDVHGDLNVTATQVDNGDGTSDVSFTITYTRPEGGPYDGVNPTITLFFDGVQQGSSTTEFLSSSGSVILTFGAVPAGTITLQAQYGDLVSRDSVTISATALSLNPATLAFAAGALADTNQDALISGGTAPYTATSSTTDLSPIIFFGNTLSVILNQVAAPATGLRTATITVRDISNSAITLNVTY
jgi:hypothetical protein